MVFCCARKGEPRSHGASHILGGSEAVMHLLLGECGAPPSFGKRNCASTLTTPDFGWRQKALGLADAGSRGITSASVQVVEKDPFCPVLRVCAFLVLGQKTDPSGTQSSARCLRILCARFTAKEAEEDLRA